MVNLVLNQRKRYGNFKKVNQNQTFLKEYMDKNYLLINQQTKERNIMTFEEILNWKNERDLTGDDLVFISFF